MFKQSLLIFLVSYYLCGVYIILSYIHRLHSAQISTWPGQPIRAGTAGDHDHFAHVNLCALSHCPLTMVAFYGVRLPDTQIIIDAWPQLSPVLCKHNAQPNWAPGINGSDEKIEVATVHSVLCKGFFCHLLITQLNKSLIIKIYCHYYMYVVKRVTQQFILIIYFTMMKLLSSQQYLYNLKSRGRLQLKNFSMFTPNQFVSKKFCTVRARVPLHCHLLYRQAIMCKHYYVLQHCQRNYCTQRYNMLNIRTMSTAQGQAEGSD